MESGKKQTPRKQAAAVVRAFVMRDRCQHHAAATNERRRFIHPPLISRRHAERLTRWGMRVRSPGPFTLRVFFSTQFYSDDKVRGAIKRVGGDR